LIKPEDLTKDISKVANSRLAQKSFACERHTHTHTHTHINTEIDRAPRTFMYIYTHIYPSICALSLTHTRALVFCLSLSHSIASSLFYTLSFAPSLFRTLSLSVVVFGVATNTTGKQKLNSQL